MSFSRLPSPTPFFAPTVMFCWQPMAALSSRNCVHAWSSSATAPCQRSVSASSAQRLQGVEEMDPSSCTSRCWPSFLRMLSLLSMIQNRIGVSSVRPSISSTRPGGRPSFFRNSDAQCALLPTGRAMAALISSRAAAVSTGCAMAL